MLLMVYNPDPDIGANAEIVKFCDRIWFDGDGDAKCLRSVIVHVLDQSKRSVRELCFLTPVATSDIVPQEIVDKSDTCASPDWAFNSFKTGGYHIEQTDASGGTIFNDGFSNVVFRYGNRAEIAAIANASLITIGLAQPIQPGEFREVRFLFGVKSLAKKYKKDTYAIDLPYFAEFTSFCAYTAATKVVKGQRQIPVIPKYDMASNNGGFDVIIYLPPGTTGSDFPPQALKSIDDHGEDGVQSESREKYIWRLRQVTDASAVIAAGGDFWIVGNWSPGLQRGISDVDRMMYLVAMRLDHLQRSFKGARAVAIASIVIAITTLILYLVLG